MGLETGDSISFILTIFTVILGFIPAIIPSKTNDLPPTNLALFQATVDLSDKDSAKNNFFAKSILHKMTNSGSFVTDDDASIYFIDKNGTNNSIYDKLTDAVRIYNNESINVTDIQYKNTINNLTNSFPYDCKNLIDKNPVCKEIRFTGRLLDLEVDNDHDFNEDRFNCKKIINDTHKCSYEELESLTKINSQMKKGFINYFYNERNVSSLEKPIESFVSGLNQFFIAALLSGPSIFLTYIKLKGKISE